MNNQGLCKPFTALMDPAQKWKGATHCVKSGIVDAWAKHKYDWVQTNDPTLRGNKKASLDGFSKIRAYMFGDCPDKSKSPWGTLKGDKTCWQNGGMAHWDEGQGINPKWIGGQDTTGTPGWGMAYAVRCQMSVWASPPITLAPSHPSTFV